MNKRNRENRFNYTKTGEFQLLEMQCERCKYKGPDPMVCQKFIERKPNLVLRAEADCPKFELKV